MAASTANAAFGTLFKFTTSGLTTVALVTSVNGFGISATSQDVTHMESPSNFREFIKTVLDGGTVDLSLTYDPDLTIHANLLDATYGIRANNTVGIAPTNPYMRACTIIMPDGIDFSFNAFVLSFTVDAPVDGTLTARASFKVSGAVADVA